MIKSKKTMRCLLFVAISIFIFSCNGTKENSASKVNEKDKVDRTVSDPKKGEKFTVAFYNVENLFDIYDDPKTNDNQFLPSSEKRWTAERYSEKLRNLGRVLSTLNANAGDEADLIGLVEIENEQVINDLKEQGELGKTDYKVVHEESPDNRGIDVGLIYNSDVFKYESHTSLRVDFVDNPDIKTRDILYIQGEVNNQDLHVFVNHWSSRRDGAKETEFKRLNCANVVQRKIEEIQWEDPDAKILLMGDFNDYPNNKSIREVIKADGGPEPDHFFNTAASSHGIEGIGTYNYRGDWVMLDQIMVSNPLRNSKDLELLDETISIVKEEWMMYKHPKYGDYRPNRSYGGTKYFGGFSDHLPVYIQFQMN
ncbi:MAG: hypothetical protein HKN39_04150 [Flavobacteriales bacterium]|nr:hypothetical protein [Flavobacteriales bacterium]